MKRKEARNLVHETSMDLIVDTVRIGMSEGQDAAMANQIKVLMDLIERLLDAIPEGK